MAFLREIGRKFPVVAEGFEVPLDDETTEMYAGDIMETQFSVDGDLTADAIQEIVHGVLKMKEEYPYFVLHYLKFETRTITAQYSIAPEGQEASPFVVSALVHQVVVGILAIIAALALLYLLHTLIERDYILRGRLPTGNALVTTKDHKTGRAIANVKLSVDGNEVGTTGASGEPVLVENLLAGPHVFTGEPVEGYWDPKSVHYDVIKDEQIVVTIVYHPEDEPPPTHGYLVIDTTPVKGEVWIEGESHGIAPIAPVWLLEGEYDIFFGEIVGYIAPPPQTATVIAGETEGRVGKYTLPGINWWEKYLKYALIGGGVILGAALLLPELIKAITRRGKNQ